VKILSVDPGKNVGYALWEPDGTVIEGGAMEIDSFLSFLAELTEVDTIVYERFQLLRRQKQQTGSHMEASQVVGALRLYAEMKGVDLVRQNPDILPVSALHAGVKLPKGHTPDALSAYLHGHYYFVGLGILHAQQVE
jgi:hypothetical protein